MTLSLTANDSFPYQLTRHKLEAERLMAEGQPQKVRPTFKLRGLTNIQHAELKNLTQYDEHSGLVRLNVGTKLRETVRAGLVGWEHLQDPKAPGTEKPYEVGPQCLVLGRLITPPAEHCLDAILWEDCEELAAEIERLNRLSLDEGKG